MVFRSKQTDNSDLPIAEEQQEGDGSTVGEQQSDEDTLKVDIEAEVEKILYEMHLKAAEVDR